MFACGFNGFHQLHLPYDKGERQYTINNSVISTPCEIEINTPATGKPGSGTTEPDNNSVVAVAIGWDRICYTTDGNMLVQHGSATVPDLEITRGIRDVALSWRFTYQLNEKGTVTVTDSFCGTSGSLVTVVESSASDDTESSHNVAMSVHAGGQHAVALLQDGRVGLISQDLDRDSWLCQPLDLHLKVKAISCGKEHVMLLTRIGVVLTFGTGGQGQLGQGDIENRVQPSVVEALEGLTVMQITAGGWHSMALSDIGDVYVWGWNERGQLGLPSRMVREGNQKLSRVTSLGHGQGLDECHEPSQTFQSEDTSSEYQDSSSTLNFPRSLEEPGLSMTCAGHTSPRSSEGHEDFVNILVLPGVLDIQEGGEAIDVTAVSAGSRHSAAVSEKGSLFTWGWNNYGQLGHGDTLSRDKPTPVPYFMEKHLRVTGIYCGCWNTVLKTAK